MKKLFTLLTICCAVFALNAQNFTENFNDGVPSNWVVLDVNNNGNSWASIGDLLSPMTGGAYSGSVFDLNQDADGDAVASWSYYPSSFTGDGFAGISQNADNWLISPVIKPTSNSTLSFYCMSFNGSSYPDDLKVMVSTTAGTTTADFDATIMPLTSISWSEYTEQTISLAAYAGQNIRIAFVHQSYDMFGVLLDEVTVTNVDGTGINDVENTVFSIYPNPATDILNVNGEGVAEVYNTIGQMVISNEVNGTAQINVSSLESGVYYVRMNGNTQRFIKK